MVTDLVIDQEGRRLCILEEGKNAEKKCCWYWTVSPRVGAVSDCLQGKGRGYHGLEDVTRVFSLTKSSFLPV